MKRIRELAGTRWDIASEIPGGETHPLYDRRDVRRYEASADRTRAGMLQRVWFVALSPGGETHALHGRRDVRRYEASAD